MAGGHRPVPRICEFHGIVIQRRELATGMLLGGIFAWSPRQRWSHRAALASARVSLRRCPQGQRHVPRICEFYGIRIYMYREEHPPPHFHAQQGGLSASIAFDGRVLHGRLHPRALRMVREWVRLHEGELQMNWRRALDGRPLVRIEPLE
jgi:hypothetical protein